MADALIETVDQNPYEGILNDITSQLSVLNENISKVSQVINGLEKLSPNSSILAQLRERLNSLQTEKEQLWTQQNSAAAMMSSYNSAAQRLDTLKGIYDLKQQQLEKAKAESDIAYDMMYEDTKSKWDNYINALWQAQASEDAIINANAGRMGQWMQSVAETRARNYLANARQQNEAALSNQQLLNDIRTNRINNNNALLQMSSADADNYLRQQVLTDQELAENERNRQFQKEMQELQNKPRGGGWGSSSTPKVTTPTNNIPEWFQIGKNGKVVPTKDTVDNVVDIYNEFKDPEQKSLTPDNATIMWQQWLLSTDDYQKIMSNYMTDEPQNDVKK